jgi:Anion-transporting ATPase
MQSTGQTSTQAVSLVPTQGSAMMWVMTRDAPSVAAREPAGGGKYSERRLIVLGGKGGVGKTLVACALARAAVARGRRVLLLELDARESLHRFLGCAPSDGGVVAVAPGLDAQSLRPRDVVDRWIGDKVRPRFVARRVLRSVIYEQFVSGAPGLRQVAALGHAVDALEGEAWDLVLLDAPATGHGASLLQAPRLLAEAIGGGPVAARARQVAAAIEDAAVTALWAVATAERMALREALDLDRRLRDGLGRGLDGLVLNMLLPADGEAAEKVDDRDVSTAVAAEAFWRRRVDVQAAHQAWLAREWPGEPLRLPLSRHDGMAAVTELTAVLRKAV